MREGLPAELTSEPEKNEQGGLTRVKVAGQGVRSPGAGVGAPTHWVCMASALRVTVTGVERPMPCRFLSRESRVRPTEVWYCDSAASNRGGEDPRHPWRRCWA